MGVPFVMTAYFRMFVCWLGLHAFVVGQAPDVAGWIRQIGAFREEGKSAKPEEIAKLRESQWLRIAEAHPVLADWVLQDLGNDAVRLLDEGNPAPARRMLEKIGAPPVDGESVEAMWERYVKLATERRKRRIEATMTQWGPVAFTEGHSFRMSFIGYTEGLSDARNERFFEPGARLSMLEFPQGSVFGEKKVLLDDPQGMMRDVDVSFDRERLLFAWKKSDRLDDYHLHEVSLLDGSCSQLTEGLGRADYEPIYLPDGDIVFSSTRPEQSVPCWWTEISNLYRMDGRGKHIRRLAVDQVHAIYPQLLADGRVVYTRWDYNDRGQVYPHPVFSMNPDGQDQRAFYGGNSWYPTSLLHTRGIPGSHKAMSIAAGHHTWQQGKLVVLDTNVGRDEGPGMTFIGPRREVPYERVDAAMQGGDQFRYPYPFSENEFLISYRPEWGVKRFGLYWMNADGERELLYADETLDVARMVTIGKRPEVSKIPNTVDYKKNTGTYYVKDVYQGVGLQGIPRGAAKKIRVVRLDYRAAGVGQSHNSGEGGGALNSSPVAIGNGTWDVKQILGDVEVEPDGSARFEVPAMESIYLQVLDERGRVIQTTRTWDTLMPGETKGCTGCHDKTNGNRHPYQLEDTLAWKRDPQKLQPFHGPTRGFSFPKEIQPILDAKCVSCHDGSKPEVMDLRGELVADADLNLRKWSRSYLNLVNAVRAPNGGYRADPGSGAASWISKMSRPTEVPPYFAGAEKSRLLKLLEQGHHEVALTKVEYEKIAAWMDLLVPFSGDYWEGNDWNPQQKAYYHYYEGKREVSTEEQKREILAYLTKDGKPADQAPGFTRARYREVLRDVPLENREGRWFLTNQAEPAMIDRMKFRAEKEARVSIKNGRSGELLGSVHVRPGVETPPVLLKRPVRSDVVVFEAETPVTLTSAEGVSVSEVPVIDGYHPFLDLQALR